MNLTYTQVLPRETLDVLTEKPRIATIDIMRGIVMVLMALDHARDFYHEDAFQYDPTNLERTTPILFLTRFITHFCAPTFVLLAGTAVRISQQRKTKKELSWFLLSRGLWLILLEVTVVRFSMFFQFYYDVTIFQVIWAIGFCMVVMAAIIHLPFRAVLALGLIITFGHDVLHLVQLQPGDRFLIPWTFIHQSNFIQLFPGVSAMVPYPFLPWLGILLLGYCLGEWYTKGFDVSMRKKLLLRTGVSAIFLFVLLRTFNLYGDPAPWIEQKDAVYTFLSFINVTKYPVSLQYTLLTLGPVLIILSWLEKVNSAAFRPFAIIGRVPLFYYILHFYLLHLSAIVLYTIRTDKGWTEIDFHLSAGFGGLPQGYGYPLVGAYIAWILVVLFLYPFCKWYNNYKGTHKHWWLSYL
ncbi:MAG: heparan-alpha-glucosaminide N-acetyltransferase domain-containing protein [Cyclobacteriaceae bacterium]